MRRWEMLAIFFAATAPSIFIDAYRPLPLFAGSLLASIVCEALEKRRRARAKAQIDVVDVFR